MKFDVKRFGDRLEKGLSGEEEKSKRRKQSPGE